MRPATGQPGSSEQDRLSAQARNLDQAAEGYRQGRVASRRTLSLRRLHRDEHEPPGRARRCFLQQARDVRAMDQGGQRREATPEPIKDWSLTSLKEKLIKIGAKV